MKYFSAFLDIRRYKNLAHKIVFWKYLARLSKGLFYQRTECLVSALHPELLSGGVESQQLSKSLQAINAGEGVEKREPSYTVGGNAN